MAGTARHRSRRPSPERRPRPCRTPPSPALPRGPGRLAPSRRDVDQPQGRPPAHAL